MTTIEIWSDWACPFCWIGKKNLEVGLEMLDLATPEERAAADVKIVYRAFLLNPSGPMTEAETKGRNFFEEMQATKGWGPDQTRQIFASVTEKGKAIDLEFNFDKVKNAGTRRGHLILKLLEEKYGGEGKDLDLWPVSEALFGAYFRDGVDFKDSAALLKATGLDDSTKDKFLTVAELDAAVSLDKTNAAVQKFQGDLAKANQMRISGVPLFVFDSKGAVSGAQPPETLASALRVAMKKK